MTQIDFIRLDADDVIAESPQGIIGGIARSGGRWVAYTLSPKREARFATLAEAKQWPGLAGAVP